MTRDKQDAYRAQDVMHALRRYGDLAAEIKQIDDTIRKIRWQMESPMVSYISGLPKGTCDRQEKLAEAMDKLDELCGCYLAQLSALTRLQKDIEQLIAPLCPRDRQIVRLRFFDGRSWPMIGAKVGCSERHAQRLLESALQQLAARPGAKAQ